MSTRTKQKPAPVVNDGLPVGQRPTRNASGIATADPRAGFFYLQPAKIQRSSNNPRKLFDPEKLAELAADVKAHGILQPLLVRLCDRNSRYELVAGERRLRAAEIAGLAEVPCIVQEMSDLEADERRIVENDQREDLTVLERAAGYQRLLDDHGMTVEDLAVKISRSKGYVYACLKLTQLPDRARKAVEDGKLAPATAQLIARIPGEQAREEAAKFAINPAYYSGDPPSYRSVKENIQQRHMVELKQAPFKLADADLSTAAGSCKDCPKRTGNSKDLYPDSRADVCTDPECYRGKVKAHVVRARETVRRSGVKVLDDDDSESALKMGIDQYGRSKWLDLAAEWRDEHGVQQVAARLEQRLDAERVYAMGDNGQGHYLIPRKMAVELIGSENQDRQQTRKVSVPNERDIRDRAKLLALQQIAELGLVNFEDLPETNVSYHALQLACWGLWLDEIDVGPALDDPISKLHPEWFGPDLTRVRAAGALSEWVVMASPRALLAHILQLACSRILRDYAPEFTVKMRDELLKNFTDAESWKALEKCASKQLMAEMRGKGKPAKVRRCRVCGCTDDDCSQCVEKTGGPCTWIQVNLCSACQDEQSKSRKAAPVKKTEAEAE